MSGIWTSPTHFSAFSTSERESLFSELATREAAGSDLADFLGFLPDPDPILRKRGEDARVLAELTADDQVCMAMQNRKLGTLLKQDYALKPGSPGGAEPDRAATRLCEEFSRDLENIDLYHLISEVLDAPFFGHTVVELFWRAEGGRIRLADAVAKPRSWFRFDDDNQLLFVGLDAPQGVPVPEYKFLLARHFPTYENPYGLRLLSRCLWPVAFKKGGIRFWTNFVERFGSPWVVGKARPSADAGERSDMLSSLVSMTQTATAVVNSGAEVDIHETSGRAGDLHRAFVGTWDAAISKVLMGQTLTAELGETGSRAASETHYSVLGDYRAADERIVRTFFEDLGWIYGRLNAPDAATPVFEYIEPEDQAEQADLAGKMRSAGARFRKAFFVRRFGLAEDEFETELDSAPVSQDENFAEGPDDPDSTDDQAVLESQDALERMIAGLLPEAERASEERTRQILKIVEAAENWEDLQLMLAEAMADLTGGDFEDLLQRAILAADMHGRFSARDESDAREESDG